VASRSCSNYFYTGGQHPQNKKTPGQSTVTNFLSLSDVEMQSLVQISPTVWICIYNRHACIQTEIQFFSVCL